MNISRVSMVIEAYKHQDVARKKEVLHNTKPVKVERIKDENLKLQAQLHIGEHIDKKT